MLSIILYLIIFSAARKAASSYEYPRSEPSAGSSTGNPGSEPSAVLSSGNLRFDELEHDPRIYVAAPSGVLVVTIRAFHIDDPNTKVLYRLHGENAPSSDAHFFQINADSGNLTTKRYIDRPVGSIYEVIVIAYTLDGGIEYINLTIQVTSYNKFPPHFRSSNYRIEVGLLTPVGTELAVVHAIDSDPEPYNAEVYYVVQSRSALINVNRLTGVVTLMESLPQRFRDLVFTIFAYDGGSPHRSARTKLTMTIKIISAPRDVVVKHTGYQWAMLCWDPPISGIPLGYIISLTTDFVSSVPTTRNITVNELGHKSGRICTALADLESWSNFEARIAGWDAQETGLMSPWIRFNTKVNRTCYSRHNNDFKCSCLAGFYGTNCSLFNPCNGSVSPCSNGGTCSSKKSEQYTCECPPGYQGLTCEQYNPCELARCQHNSTCYNETATTYGCKCLPGYTGKLCETDIDECAVRPCQNGGTCSDEIGKFTCTCRPGFQGERCEVNINECSSNPCQNGASCIDGEASFTCQCPPGYTGDYCDEEVNECTSWPCFNGGTCIDAFNDYKCNCPPGFTGARCEIDIDLCASQPCKNGGHCVDHTHFLTCQCPVGFNGEFCQTREHCHAETLRTSKGNFTWPNLDYNYIALMECPYGLTTNETLVDALNKGLTKRSIRDKNVNVWKVDCFDKDADYLYASGERKEHRCIQMEKTLRLSSLQQNQSIAFRSCILMPNGSAVWTPMLDGLCREEGFNTAVEISQHLENLTRVPSHISPDMFLQATNQINQIMNYALKDRKIAQTMISVLSNMLDVNETILDEADKNGSISRGLINTIDSFAEEVDVPLHSNISFASPNIALQVFNIGPSDEMAYNYGIMYSPSFDSFDSSVLRGTSLNLESSQKHARQTIENDVNLILPHEAIQRAATKSNPVRIQFISYNNKKLFRSYSSKISNKDLAGQVLTASVKNTVITNLSQPLTYNMRNKYGNRKQICVYWDVKTLEWQTNGMLTNQTPGWISCQSTHLTAFAVLLNLSPYDENLIPEEHEAMLTIISFVGAVLSTIGLLFTIFTYAIFRCLNRDRSGKILLNLCFSLLLMNVSYLLLTFKTYIQHYFDQADICMAIALSTHYLVLTSFAWMLVEAVNMYQLLITVFASSETRFIMKRMILAWGVPLCIVGGTLSYTGFQYYKFSETECIFSPQNPNVYYISYIGPACIILFINCVVFLRVSRVLCQRRTVGKHTMNTKGGITAAQVRGAFTVMTLLGVTWITGIFAIGKFRLVFRYLFCICNSLQGFIIFVVRCVQYPEARSAWSTLFRTGQLKKHRGPKAGVGPLSHTTSSTQQTRVTGKADLTV